MKIDPQELETALQEIKARTQEGVQITVRVDGNQLTLSAIDRNDNEVRAILYNNCSLGAQFRTTERLMYMKKGK